MSCPASSSDGHGHGHDDGQVITCTEVTGSLFKAGSDALASVRRTMSTLPSGRGDGDPLSDPSPAPPTPPPRRLLLDAGSGDSGEDGDGDGNGEDVVPGLGYR